MTQNGLDCNADNAMVTILLPWVSAQSIQIAHSTTVGTTNVPPTPSSEELGQSHLTTLQQQSTTGAAVSGKAVAIYSQSKATTNVRSTKVQSTTKFTAPKVDSKSTNLANASTMARTTTTRTNMSPTTGKPIIHKRAKVCYDTLGCFNNSPPYIHTVTPWSPEKIDVNCLLYTREWPPGNETVRIVYNEQASLRNSNFSTSRPTKFVIHGFNNDIKTEWPYVMKDELLKNHSNKEHCFIFIMRTYAHTILCSKADVNVFLVFWGNGANLGFLYDQAATNTQVVAAEIRVLILNMVSLGADVNQVHLIGHSLGAHTSGYVGGRLKSDHHLVLGRITGLDPADPDFETKPILVRLDKNDAAFVDVIHTNGAPFTGLGGYGLMIQCGDVDFYVNGGALQPDCPGVGMSVPGMGFMDSLSCSHGRAHEIFTETINSQMCQFVGYPCSSYESFQRGDCMDCGEDGCAVMGYASDMYTVPRGKKYLNTRRSSPFCGHQYKVLVKMSTFWDNTKGKIEIKLAGTWDTSEWIPATAAGINDEQLNRGATISHVAVMKEVIGTITSISVRFTKGSHSQDTLQVNTIRTKSGDNGEETVFCLSDVTLQTAVTLVLPWVSVQSTPSTSPATAASIHATTITDIPPTVSSEELGQSHLTTLQQQSTTGAVVSGKAVTISSQSKTPIVVSNSSPTLNASTAAKTTINRTTILPTTRKPINHTREVCYDTIGCFNNRPPYISSLPWSPQKIDVHFLLYTREWPSGNETVRIVYNDTESLRNSNFSTTRPTKFVVHGFLNDMKSPWPYVMKDELLKKVSEL
ncbi:LIPR2-like protein [Mya arenaria]|uniref:LIPR2-like protein n=1 Tax=Mya arenaria TaxID=6604 RepID=A0ABY7FQX5_MYAAR|nr:LIPR2-like protein [Mya arenaria]